MTDSAHQTGTRPLVIAVLNHKGGVGKTTTAINLAATFARAGQRVTLIDLDPQGNAATGLGLERASIAAGTAQVLSGEVTVAEALVDSRQAGLSLLAASPALAGLDIGADDRLLAQALEGVGGLDIAVLDCPPSFGPLGRNALVAADWVVVPVQPESFALEGLTQVTTTIRKIRGAHRKQLGQA
ncbi:MAG: ParA family protein, partial [Rhodospirillales bacterium]